MRTLLIIFSFFIMFPMVAMDSDESSEGIELSTSCIINQLNPCPSYERDVDVHYAMHTMVEPDSYSIRYNPCKQATASGTSTAVTCLFAGMFGLGILPVPPTVSTIFCCISSVGCSVTSYFCIEGCLQSCNYD